MYRGLLHAVRRELPPGHAPLHHRAGVVVHAGQLARRSADRRGGPDALSHGSCGAGRVTPAPSRIASSRTGVRRRDRHVARRAAPGIDRSAPRLRLQRGAMDRIQRRSGAHAGERNEESHLSPPFLPPPPRRHTCSRAGRSWSSTALCRPSSRPIQRVLARQRRRRPAPVRAPLPGAGLPALLRAGRTGRRDHAARAAGLLDTGANPRRRVDDAPRPPSSTLRACRLNHRASMSIGESERTISRYGIVSTTRSCRR